MALRLNDIEAAFRIKADQGLKALDGIVEKSKAADRGLKNLTESATRVGVGLGAVGAAITTAFAFAIKGAQAEAESLAQLEGTVNSTGASFAAQRPRIESFITGLTRVTKFSDDELRPALNRAIVATNDVDKGMRAAELGAKIAAAGFGSLEANSVLVARLFEGQVQAIGRLIPEFRDLDERLEAGATQADIAAEALARLNTIAANAPAPSGINQLNKALGEIADTIGGTALQSLAPFIARLTEAAEGLQAFAATVGGRLVTNITLVVGVLAAFTGGLLLLVGQLVAASATIGAAGGFTVALSAAGAAGTALIGILTAAGGLVAAIIAVGVVAAATAVQLNKLSKASDDARDKAFDAPRIAQFTAEMNALRSAIAGLDKGTLSAADALEVFNRFGVESRIEAEKRVRALGDIVVSLTEQKAAQDAAAKGDADRAKIDAEGKRIAAVIAKMEEEKQKRIELEIQAEAFAEAELERGKKLAAQVVPTAPPASPSGGFPGEGLSALTTPAASPIGDLDSALEDMDVFIEKTGTLEERVGALAAQSSGVENLNAAFKKADETVASLSEHCSQLEKDLHGAIAGGIGELAAIGGNLFTDIAAGVENAGARAREFFHNLTRQLTAAIARALILNSILGVFGGVGVGFGKKLSDLFQDARADQLARFEGQRFVDLFFQGVTREFGNARNRIDSTLTDNRQLVENRGAPTSIIVTEASPETTVEFTDRKVEPRVRARARQRTGNVTSPFGQTA